MNQVFLLYKGIPLYAAARRVRTCPYITIAWRKAINNKLILLPSEYGFFFQTSRYVETYLFLEVFMFHYNLVPYVL